MRHAAILVMALAIVRAALGSEPGAQQRSTTSALLEVAFDFSSRQPIIPVSVNGAAPVPFVVDTGASVHVIDADLAARAGAAAGGARTITGGGQGVVAVTTLEGLTLETGGLTWSGQRGVAAPLGYPERKHFAGLVGAPVLSQYVVQFAFDRGVIRLFDPDTFVPAADVVELPFELQEGLPIVRVIVDVGTGPLDARLMVDTGASQFIDLNRPFVERHGLDEAMSDAVAQNRRAALGTPAPFIYGTARRVVFAGRSFERPRVGLSRSSSGSSSRADRDGIVGNDLLRHFVVTVDYRRGRLLLRAITPGL